METSASNSDPYSNSSSPTTSPTSSRFGVSIPSLNFFRSPLSVILDYSGILPTRAVPHESEPIINGSATPDLRVYSQNQNHLMTTTSSSSSSSSNSPTSSSSGNTSPSGEVSIRIIGSGEQDPSPALVGQAGYEQNGGLPVSGDQPESPDEERVPLVSTASSSIQSGSSRVSESGNGVEESVNRDSSYQRYDIQQVARWIEQILPFSLLLLIVFIRQHLEGFFITICISAVMYKSNDIVKKQTALKGERKISVLAGTSIAFLVHVIGIYWWCHSDDLLHPLVMLPPKTVPPFWHALFIILVNDTMARQVAMALKCLLLIYYKNGRGHNFRRQGQILTLMEYTLLLYRALLPAPVWYRFFLNKDQGSLFSSLTTGLYLTFKLTSVVEKIQSFVAAFKALSQKEVHYGSYATSEQVSAAGDLCAICQEKMNAPILLRCKHIFCEDCVSEWFERERTCPLCRALVKPAELRTFGDGSTSLLFQLF
ncbi:E3 ubiquitin-protein ligase RNFT1-like isoform X1 [Cucurbita pepo subsp. pepo]|uniref:E3 ubiquitin-protein ligase RNFT1-like isoform X1 n=1 Tax=Cucurbita pepo subsp. pepo TaxID=3664 RepID=UPI000C9D3038|nr:E3 ubiquitin-protein ligase RNFT1-like isoform X1 [Cucurbita pepo subsp. pepo]